MVNLSHIILNFYYHKILNLFIENNDIKSVNEVTNYIYNNKKKIESYNSLKMNVILYIGELNVTEFYDWIIKNLNDRNNNVKIECIKALKKFGKIESVESLLGLTKKISISAVVKKEVIDAVKHIQKSIPEKNRGDLTIADMEKTGNLSYNEDQKSFRGNLSQE